MVFKYKPLMALREPDGTLRRSGRSTRTALKLIIEAWENPNTEIQILDHYNSPTAQEAQISLIEKTVIALSLKGFVINIDTRTLTFLGYHITTEKNLNERI